MVKENRRGTSSLETATNYRKEVIIMYTPHKFSTFKMNLQIKDGYIRNRL